MNWRMLTGLNLIYRIQFRSLIWLRKTTISWINENILAFLTKNNQVSAFLKKPYVRTHLMFELFQSWPSSGTGLRFINFHNFQGSKTILWESNFDYFKWRDDTKSFDFSVPSVWDQVRACSYFQCKRSQKPVNVTVTFLSVS